MPVSDPFEALSDEARIRLMRRLLRVFASHWLGEPDEPTVNRLECIADIDRLERIYLRGADVRSWKELLDTP